MMDLMLFRVETIYPSPFATTRIGNRYRARCTICPWTGKRWASYQDACDDADRHHTSAGIVPEHELAQCIRQGIDAGDLAVPVGEAMLIALQRGGPVDYQELWRSVVHVTPPAVVFRTAPASARDAILGQGLKVAAPERHAAEKDEPIGIVCAGLADWEGRHAPFGEAWDVWAITLGELPWLHNLRMPNSWVILADVPADAIRREVGPVG